MMGYKSKQIFIALSLIALIFFPLFALAAITPLSFTANTSEVVIVDTAGGTPSIAIDVGGVSRTATYASGSGSAAMVFTYTPVVGDVDLDGIAVSSPIVLNGGTIKDAAGNNATLTFTPPDTSNVKINYPSLSMDFVADADGRYTLNGTAYNDLPAFLAATGGSFTRNSIGTYFDSNGALQIATANTPRFDYDPVTHAPKGILIEESRRNRTLFSQDFDNAKWKQGAFVTANTATAPDGSMTADTLSQTNNVTDFIYDQNILASANTTYTFSLFFKPGTRTNDFSVVLDWKDFGSPRVSIGYTYASNLVSTGGSGASAIKNAVVQVLSNGWYRLALTFTTDTTVGKIVSMIGRLGNSTGTTYIWGAQLEQGAFPTSYIPTTTAAVTREADLLGVPAGAWFNANTGTFFAESFGEKNTENGEGFGRIIGTNTGKSFLSTAALLNGVETWSGTGSTLTQSFTPALSQTVSGKFALSWENSGNTRSLASNGQAPLTSTYLGDYTTATINIGNNSSGTNFRNAPIKKVKFYPTRVSDTQLQLMTQ